jgi:hypothetical protein
MSKGFNAILEKNILKFKDFIIMEEHFFDHQQDDQSSDVIEYLYSLHHLELTSLVNEFLQVSKAIEKKEYIEDIMNVLRSINSEGLTADKLYWIEQNLKKRI